MLLRMCLAPVSIGERMSTPGVEPGLSRPQRDVLTTRRCGLLNGTVVTGAAGHFTVSWCVANFVSADPPRVGVVCAKCFAADMLDGAWAGIVSSRSGRLQLLCSVCRRIGFARSCLMSMFVSRCAVQIHCCIGWVIVSELFCFQQGLKMEAR